MKIRLSFECWQCERTFGQSVDLEGEPVLLLKCPYCGAECKVDMAPYRQRVVTVTRGEEAGLSSKTIPTFDAGDEESEQEA